MLQATCCSRCYSRLSSICKVFVVFFLLDLSSDLGAWKETLQLYCWVYPDDLKNFSFHSSSSQRVIFRIYNIWKLYHWPSLYDIRCYDILSHVLVKKISSLTKFSRKINTNELFHIIINVNFQHNIFKFNSLIIMPIIQYIRHYHWIAQKERDIFFLLTHPLLINFIRKDCFWFYYDRFYIFTRPFFDKTF